MIDLAISASHKQMPNSGKGANLMKQEGVREYCMETELQKRRSDLQGVAKGNLNFAAKRQA